MKTFQSFSKRLRPTVVSWTSLIINIVNYPAIANTLTQNRPTPRVSPACSSPWQSSSESLQELKARVVPVSRIYYNPVTKQTMEPWKRRTSHRPAASHRRSGPCIPACLPLLLFRVPSPCVSGFSVPVVSARPTCDLAAALAGPLGHWRRDRRLAAWCMPRHCEGWERYGSVV